MKIVGKGNENIVKFAYCLITFYLDYYDFDFVVVFTWLKAEASLCYFLRIDLN